MCTAASNSCLLATYENSAWVYKYGCHVSSLTFSVTRLVWFDSWYFLLTRSLLESAFRPKTTSCGRHSARRHSSRSVLGPKRWSAFRPVGIQAASRCGNRTFRHFDVSPPGRFAPSPGRFAPWTVRHLDVSPL